MKKKNWKEREEEIMRRKPAENEEEASGFIPEVDQDI